MTPKEAYHITRPFKGFWGMEKPIPLKYIDTMSIFRTDTNNRSHISLYNSSKVKVISKNVFLKKYKKFFSENINRDSLTEINYPTEDLYITSKGITTQEDFFLAEDTMSQINKIKTKELDIGKTYISILEKKMLFLGNIKISFTVMGNISQSIVFKNILYDLSTERLLYSDNIVLLEEDTLINIVGNISRFELRKKIFNYRGMGRNIDVNEQREITWEQFN